MSAWILHAVMLLVFAAFVGAIVPTFAPGANGQRAQAGALSALAAYVVVTATVGVATGGSAWPYALSGAVWTFDVLMLALELVAFGLAIALGTPGCEMGVWRELADRLRGRPLSNTTGLACVVGLQRIDEWEAKRRAARIGRVGSRS